MCSLGGQLRGALGAVPGTLGAVPGALGSVPSGVGTVPGAQGPVPGALGTLPGALPTSFTTCAYAVPPPPLAGQRMAGKVRHTSTPPSGEEGGAWHVPTTYACRVPFHSLTQLICRQQLPVLLLGVQAIHGIPSSWWVDGVMNPRVSFHHIKAINQKRARPMSGRDHR